MPESGTQTSTNKWRLRFERWRARRAGRWVMLFILAGLCALRWYDPVVLETVRLRVFDSYQSLKPRTVDRQLVTVVDLDEASLRELGQWPWPRTLVAELVNRITKAGGVVIGFDIVFAEEDRLSPQKIAANTPGLDAYTRTKLNSLPSNDEVMAEALRNSRVVLGQTGTEFERERGVTSLPDPAPAAELGGNPRPFLFTFNDMVANTQVLREAAAGEGIFSLAPEADGIVRRIPVVVRVQSEVYPTLSFEMLRTTFGAQQQAYVIQTNDVGIQRIFFTGKNNFRAVVPTDRNGRVWVYFAKYDPNRYVSAQGILAGDTINPALAAKLAGRLILIGTSAAGLKDVIATPLEGRVPGVDVHANVLETILTEQYLSRPPEAKGWEIIVTFAVGVLIILLLPLVGPTWTFPVFLAVAGGMIGASAYLFADLRILADSTFPVAATFVTYVGLTYANYRREAAEKRQVRSAFGQYLSPALVEQLADHPEQLVLGGETREMTFLFCDVRGFTAISEQFKHDPQSLTRLINRFLTPMTDEILRRGGTIDKYMGDCIMAFWNAPLDDPQHARNACDSALAMVASLTALNTALETEAKADNRPYMPINVGVGLNTGECVVGNMGSDQHFDYSVLGDAVNLASRLEGQSKTYGVDIVAGEDTRRQCPDDAWLELDRIAVKGKTEAVTVYGLLGNAETAETDSFQALRDATDKMLNHYRAQNWDAAEQAANACAALDGAPAGLYALYKERIAHFRAAPPAADWDGVFVAEEK
jgi:adenylate cyclase